MKVIYIMGQGRSGSTILHSLLAQTPGIFGVGELRMIWEPGRVERTTCGCGLPLRECEVWSRVLNALPDLNSSSGAALSTLLRDRFLPLMMAPLRNIFLRSFVKRNTDRVRRLYEAIQSTTGCHAIVDFSKSVAYAAFLAQIPGNDLYLIHLVRDARGVECSLKHRKDQGVARFAGHNAVMGAIAWNLVNGGAERLGRSASARYCRLRYEDFIQNPQQKMASLLAWVGEPQPQLSFLQDHSAQLGVVHTIAGNAKRFEHGSIDLRPDERWKSELSPREKGTVTFLTRRLMQHYGYLSN